MAYYHVVVEINNSDKEYFDLDRTDLSKIKEKIVIPYLEGEQFRVKGYTFRPEIVSIHIKESEKTTQEYIKESDRYLAALQSPSCTIIAPPCSREDAIKDEDCFKDITDSVLEECESQIQEAMPKSNALTPDKPSKIMDTSQVFIVHGHDKAARLEVTNFIKSLGLKDIVLSEQASSGKTIIEKLEEYTNVGFGIVLYTPCDLGASQEEKELLKPRARQNVVFEHGYLMGKIGRENVCALVKGDIEKPTDIAGVNYIPMDEGGGWKLGVAREMNKSGYEIDLNKLLE